MFFIIFFALLLIFPLYYIGVQLWAIYSLKDFFSEKKSQKEKENRELQIFKDEKTLSDIFISANAIPLEKLMNPKQYILISTELEENFERPFSTTHIHYNKNFVRLFYSFRRIRDENFNYNYNYIKHLLVLEYQIKTMNFTVHNEFEFKKYFEKSGNSNYPDVSRRYDYLKKIITSKTIQELVESYEIMKQKTTNISLTSISSHEIVEINYYFKNNESTYIVFCKDSNEKYLLNEFLSMLIEVRSSTKQNEIPKHFTQFSRLKIERSIKFNEKGYHVFVDIENLKLMFYNEKSYNYEFRRYRQYSRENIYSQQPRYIDFNLKNGFIDIVDFVKELNLYLQLKKNDLKEHLMVRIYYKDFFVYSFYNEDESNFDETKKIINKLASIFLK